MLSRSSLFVCVIAVAAFGCRDRDTTMRETSFSRPVESTETPPAVPMPEPTPEPEPEPKTQFTAPVEAPAVDFDVDVDDDADTSSMPNPGGTDGVQSTNSVQRTNGRPHMVAPNATTIQRVPTPEPQPAPPPEPGEGEGARSSGGDDPTR